MTYRSLYAALAASTCIVALATPAVAQTRSYNIPASDLATALDSFARQSGVQIVYKVDEVQGARSKSVKGNLDADDALRRLLSGSGFEARRDGASFAVVRLGNGQGATAEGGDQSAGIADILVIGSRSQNVDIRRTKDDAQPYVIFKSEDIEKSQATNLEDFLRTRLPMNTQAGPAGQSSLSGQDNSNIGQVNLRGLGAEQTLILVDGRRAPRILGLASNTATANGNIFTQADINGIPLAAIDRIEVLPSTAGGIYGGGAVGGVINIIRKRDYRGLQIGITRDGAFGGGGETTRIDLTGGFSPDHGRTQISFSASYANSDPLYAKDNDLWKRARARYASIAANADGLPLGYTTNVMGAPTFANVPDGTPGAECYGPGLCYLITSPNLVLKNGTALGSDRTYVPIGYAGVGSDGGTALVANAGKFNLDLPNDGNGSYALLANSPKVISGNVSIRRELGRKIDAFIDLTATRNQGRSFFALPRLQLLLGSDSGNPFQQDVLIAVPTPGIGTPVTSTVFGWGARGGLIAKLGKGWGATIEASHDRVESRTRFTSYPVDDVRLSQAFASGQLDAFQDVNARPIDYTSYLLPSPDSDSGKVVTEQNVFSARAAGPLINLPAGPLNITALVEHREERAPRRVSNSIGSETVWTPRSQSVNSVYLEARIPIFGKTNTLPMINSLELQASVRHDRYETQATDPSSYSPSAPPSLSEDTGSVRSTNFTVALKWVPLDGLVFRGSYATGFLPPNVGQITSTTVPSLFDPLFLDPLRGNTPVPAHTSIVGGRIDLNPEQSKSFSLGVIISPTIIKGFRLSVDYTRIKRAGEIVIPPKEIGFLSTYFPDRIVRDPDPATFGPYGVGPILSVDTSFLNLAKSRFDALDIQADQIITTKGAGEFHIYVAATRTLKFERQYLPTSPLFDSIGFSDGPLKWRGSAGIDWTLGRWSVGWNAQYYDAYSLRTSNPVFPEDDYIASQGRDRFPSQIYNDLSIRFQFGESGAGVLRGVQLTAGVRNIFNARPPVFATTSAVATYSPYGDPRLRRYSLAVSKAF